MVKDMDSYIDRCIGKEDFFKLATVNDLNSQKTVLGKVFAKMRNTFTFIRTFNFSISRLVK